VLCRFNPKPTTWELLKRTLIAMALKKTGEKNCYWGLEKTVQLACTESRLSERKDESGFPKKRRRAFSLEKNAWTPGTREVHPQPSGEGLPYNKISTDLTEGKKKMAGESKAKKIRLRLHRLGKERDEREFLPEKLTAGRQMASGPPKEGEKGKPSFRSGRKSLGVGQGGLGLWGKKGPVVNLPVRRISPPAGKEMIRGPPAEKKRTVVHVIRQKGKEKRLYFSS